MQHYQNNPDILINVNICGAGWSKIGEKSFKQLHNAFCEDFADNGGTKNY